MLNSRIIITPGGSVGAILGTYDIFGTATGAETVTVFDDTVVRLQSDFNRGGDTLRLRDIASDFQMVRQGSNVILTSVSDAITVTVPVGVAGIKVVFENSLGQLIDERILLFNGTNVVLGSQTVGFTETQVSSGLNVAPVITSATSVTIDENAPVTDLVYRVTATDANAGQTLTYSLAGTDAALFTINSSTGEVRLRQSANFEAKQSYAISVQASDGIATTAQAVTVSVRNLVDQLEIGGGGDGSISSVDARGTLADLLDVNYRFLERVADANDVVISRFTANDVLSFDGPLSGYSFSSTGNDLVISQNADGVVSRIVLQGVVGSTQFVFDASTANTALNQALGTTNVNYLVVGTGSVNASPVVANSIPDRSVAEDTAWTYQFPANTFSDPDGSALTLSAMLADGSALPAWLSFNAATRTFSGTPPLNFNGTIDLRVTASDGSASVNDVFRLTVTPVNDAPTVNIAIPDQMAAIGRAWSFVVPVNSFIDVDNDNLLYSATLTSGAAIPSWLTFNASTRGFSGVIPSNFNQSLDIRVSASDGTSSVSDAFTLRGQPVLYEFRVNTFTQGDQTRPAMIVLADGGWVIVWASVGQDGDQAGIFGQRYSRDGLLIGNEFRANTVTVGGQSDPRIAALADGGWVVSWSSFAGGSSEVISQRYNAAGLPVGGEFQSNSFTTGDQWEISTAGLPNGGWVTLWQSPNQDGSGSGVYGRQYSSSGAPIGSEFRVNANTVGDQRSPAVTDLKNGNWLAVWQSFDSQGSNTGIYGKIYGPSGTVVKSDFRIDVQSAGKPVVFEDWFAFGLTPVATLNDGTFIVVWLSEGQQSRNYTIVARKFDQAGNPISDQFDVANVGLAYQPVITALADGQLLVAWHDFSESFGLRLSSSGGRLGDVFSINQTKDGLQFAPAVSSLGDGGWIATWISQNSTVQTGQDGSGAGIFAQRFDRNGVPISTPTTSAPNLPPTTTPRTASVNEDAVITGVLVATDPDPGSTLTFGLVNPVAGLTLNANGSWTFDASNASYQGLATGQRQDVVANFGVTDDRAATSTSTLTIAVTGINDAPTVSAPIPDQTTAAGANWSYVVPANSFADVDNEVLRYSAMLASGAALPSWLNFNSATRAFSGVAPTAAQNLSVRVTASDNALSVSDTFVLAVGGVTQDIRGLVFSTTSGTTSAAPQLNFSVLMSSIFSQASSISLLFWAVGNEQSSINIARDPTSGLFDSSVTLGAFAKAGPYAIRRIMVQDNFGEIVSFNESQIVAMGLTPTATLQNARADTTAPRVTSFSIGGNAKNASGQIEVNFAVTASDAQSGLKDSFILELLSPSGKSLQQIFTLNSSGAANPVFVLDPLSPSGTYKVNTIRLTDNAGNGNLSQDFLATVPSSITISNPTGDNGLPVLTSFSMSAAREAQSSRPIVTINLRTTDNLSGVDRVLIGLKDQNGVLSQENLYQGNSLNLMLTKEVAFPIGTSSTGFEVDFLLISDRAGNQILLSANDMRNLGFQTSTQLPSMAMAAVPADSWSFA